jgi:hypothetical protein
MTHKRCAIWDCASSVGAARYDVTSFHPAKGFTVAQLGLPSLAVPGT